MAEDALPTEPTGPGISATTGTHQPVSSHRLPTVSASQILQSVTSDGSSARITSSLPGLDAQLGSGKIHVSSQGEGRDGGFARGTVNEIWGPPGAGTTAFALQVAHNTLETIRGVIWIDSSLTTPEHRLASLPPGLNHYTAPTLAHLLALLHHPPPWLPLSSSTLLVLSDIQLLVDASYSRYTRSNLPDPARWAATRRSGVLGTLMGAIKRVAAVHDLAVLLTTGCATQTRPESNALGAVLVPGIVGAEWDQGVATRLVVFRDLACSAGHWSLDTAAVARGDKECRSARFIGVQKLNGVRIARQDGVGALVRFGIGDSGRIHEIVVANEVGLSAASSHGDVKSVLGKRAFGQVADSDEDDLDAALGWTEQDIGVLQEDLLQGETVIV